VIKLQLSIDIPRPSRYVSHGAVDDIANCVAHTFTEFINSESRNCGLENFVEQVLNKEITWLPIDEPDGRICFASIDQNRITLNENHRPLFESKPFLLDSCFSHEIGHEILGHLDLLRPAENQAGLFGEEESNITFHDSRWTQLGLTREEFAELRNKLAQTSFSEPENLQILRTLDDKLEPEWMYYQAEQFAACFLIPRHSLFDHLETGLDITNWPTLYRLAEQFGVSISMMTVRLQKLKIVEIEGKSIKATGHASQSTLKF
jgi:hypothetical protein